MRTLTKQEMFDAITKRLKENGKSVCVKDFGYELRSGFGSMRAYEIKYEKGKGLDGLFCHPFAGSNILWRTDFFRLNKAQITTIYERTMSE